MWKLNASKREAFNCSFSKGQAYRIYIYSFATQLIKRSNTERANVEQFQQSNAYPRQRSYFEYTRISDVQFLLQLGVRFPLSIYRGLSASDLSDVALFKVCPPQTSIEAIFNLRSLKWKHLDPVWGPQLPWPNLISGEEVLFLRLDFSSVMEPVLTSRNGGGPWRGKMFFVISFLFMMCFSLYSRLTLHDCT